MGSIETLPVELAGRPLALAPVNDLVVGSDTGDHLVGSTFP
ncbi:hypothetical protein ACFYVR_11580 [Rhodococcus sp. NPDC003318]